jgi:hypothetical protein
MRSALTRTLGAAVVVLSPSPAEAQPRSVAATEASPGSREGSSAPTGVLPDEDRFGWAVPDYFRLQTGGFLGMFTVGVGYSALRDVLNVGVGYGYVPPLDGAPHVHLGNATLTIRPLRWSLGSNDRFYYYPIYVGCGGMLASSPNLFATQPAVYPQGYYAPNALNFLLLFRTEFAVRQDRGALLERQSVFVEFVTINQYLDALNQNREVSLLDAFSTAFGYRASF